MSYLNESTRIMLYDFCVPIDCVIEKYKGLLGCFGFYKSFGRSF
jgi:hypothetical protein